MRNRLIPLCLLAFLLVAPLSAAAQVRYKAAGVLTEKDSSGELVISGKQYVLGPAVDIYDDRGDTLTDDELAIQSRYYIEYEQPDVDGVRVIKLMKLLPQ